MAVTFKEATISSLIFPSLFPGSSLSCEYQVVFHGSF